ncbi:hypothetical protein [Methylocella sp.]|uniref:hypothetical protein n=1 Tax=Methylocella sp. TaxID=1978226 RepID=UPI003C207003
MLAIAVLGLERIDPRNTSWLSGDFVMMQFGWYGYRFDRAPAWMMTTDRLSWPLPIAIAMFDLVPIAALPLRLLSGHLPLELQYFGPLFVVNAALQGLFAFLLFYEIANRMLAAGALLRLAVAVVAALFIVASPTLYQRIAFTHPPLTAHWLIIAALWLYARCDRVSLATTIGSFTALLFLGGGINPYLVVMASGIYIGCLLRLLWQGRWSLLAFGFVGVGGEGVLSEGGYGFFSSNALSLIDPMQSPRGGYSAAPDHAIAGTDRGVWISGLRRHLPDRCRLASQPVFPPNLCALQPAAADRRRRRFPFGIIDRRDDRPPYSSGYSIAPCGQKRP